MACSSAPTICGGFRYPSRLAAPERFRGLIGEYGWDHNTLYILERDGKLTR